MTRKLFPEGGPLHARSRGGDRYEMSISIPRDKNGRMARECPDAQCSPGYFKVKPGTGITANHVEAFCPYCRRSAAPNDFSTREQARYAKELVLREAHKGVQGMLQDALGLGAGGKRTFGGGLVSMTMTYKPGSLPQVRRPFEDEVRRDVICPHCTLDQTVFGLATWCADCGRDIFLRHVAAELKVVEDMVGDVDRRRELLGPRVEAKDLENCLEDAVSIFEAALKAMVRRGLQVRGDTPDEVDLRLKKLGNTFQSIARTREQLTEIFVCPWPADVPWQTIIDMFEKRHPITHNLGVVDRKYLERAQARERQGREVRIAASEVRSLLASVSEAIGAIHALLFVPVSEDVGAAAAIP